MQDPKCRDAKIHLRIEKTKTLKRIFQNYFNRRQVDDFDFDEDGQAINKIPIAQIRWVEARYGYNRIVLVNRYHRNKSLFPHPIHENSLKNLKGKKHSGLMTDYVVLGIKRAFEKMLVYSEPFQAYDFKTGKHRSATMIAWLLTVPQGYGSLQDKTFNQLVSELIKRIGQKYPQFRMYLGKNEYTKKGMEHCHLDVNTFIDYYWMHRTWFTILKKQRCFKLWLKDHPKNDPDHREFDAKSQYNLVRYRPLWNASSCINYLRCYLKKMTQNKVPIKGRVWFQSKYLAHTPLPLIRFSNQQQQLLYEAQQQNHVNVSTVNLNFYPVDGEGVISDIPHHSKTLCTIFKQAHSKLIYHFLTTDNRNRLIRYRNCTREGTQIPTPHGAVSEFRVIWAKHANDKPLDREICRLPGIAISNYTQTEIKDTSKAILKKLSGNEIFYSKVKIEKL